jgi:hypothetical protein
MIPLEKDTVYAFMLRDGQEVLGELKGLEGGYLKLVHPAFAYEQQPDIQGDIPKKVLVNGTEGGNFGNELIFSEDKIIFVKTVIKNSELWQLYTQSVSDDLVGKKKEYKS